MSRKAWLAIIFFFSGVGVMTARTGQQGGMYLFQFLIPLCLAHWDKRYRSAIGAVGVAGLGLFCVFDVMDVIHWTMSGMAYHLPGSILAKSKFSSILGITSVLFLIVSRDRVGRGESGERVAPQFFLGWFVDGLAAGSVALLLYACVQFVTGFDFSSVSAYRADRMLATGFYRVPGLSSHPISLAALSLGLAVFCGAWSRSGEALRSIAAEKTILQRLGLSPERRLVIAALSQGALVLLSGSRTATAILLGFAAVWGGIIVREQWHRKWVRGAAAFAVVMIAAGLHRVGFVGRVAELFHGQHGGDQRENFWRVYKQMILDSPWIGQGRYHLEEIARDAYYDAMFPGRTDIQRYNAHNIFLEIIATGGVCGAILFAAAAAWFARSVRNLAEVGGLLGISMWMPWCLAIAANVLHGLTQNTFFDSAPLAVYCYPLWLWVGLTLYRDSLVRSAAAV